jgi:UDP-glucose 4-epimerase
MRYLVTGGAGFVGSHLVDQLVLQGHEVIVWDDFTTGRKENRNPKASYYAIGVESISPQYHDKKYDAIFHLAGEARIQPSFLKPLSVHESNVTGTAKMLELARLQRCRFVYAGSSSVYHDMFANPYSFSKQIAEHYCTLYHRIYGVPVAIARFFNVYGPRQLEEGAYATVIGVFEKQKRDNTPLTITGNGEQRRDFTHVLDIVDGLIGMVEEDHQADIYNLGTGTNHSINEVAALFKHPKQYIPKRPGEAWTTLADISLSKQRLGYEPKRKLVDYVESLEGN